MAVLWFSTAGGLNVDDDGLCYIEGGRNIASGVGYQFAVPPLPPEPVTHFPPLYPAAIAALTLLVGDPHAAARWVNILCLGAEAWLACWLVWKAGGRRVSTVLAGAALALHVHGLEYHAWAFSEPLFLALSLGVIAALVRLAEAGHTRWLIAAGFLAGCSALARYSGMLWIGIAPLLVLFIAQGNWRKRLGSAVLCGAVAVLPWLIWSIRNSLLGGSAMNRSMRVHLISQAHITEGLTTISAWFLPWRFMGVPAGVLCLIASFVIVGMLLWWSLRRPPTRAFAVVATGLGVFFFLYLVHLPVAISLLHYNTPLDARLLLPALTMCLCGFGLLPLLSRTRWVNFLLIGGLSFFMLFEAARAYPWVRENRLGESGSFGSAWRDHPASAFLRTLPTDTRIYSYNRRLLWAVLGRPIHPIPTKRNIFTTSAIPESRQELRGIGEQAVSAPSVLVYIHPNRPKQNFSLDEEHAVELGHAHEFPLAELQQELALHPIFEQKGVSIYRIEGRAALTLSAP